MTNGLFEKQITITRQHCGCTGRLSAAALASLLEQTALDHRRQYGLGAKSMAKKGLLWVLVIRGVEINSLPVSGEEVILQTWNGKERNWLFPKHSRMLDKEGNLLLEASCLWALMDDKNRNLASPNDSLTAIPVTSIPEEMKAPAWTVPFPELTGHTRRVVEPFQIDYNMHMNNAWYLEWAESVLKESFRENHTLKSIWIEHNLELREGQTLDLWFTLEGTILSVKGLIEGENAFSARLEYRENTEQSEKTGR